MRITGLRARTASIPVKAPTRHSYGSPGYYSRTIVELSTDEGITGLGETYGTVSAESFAPLVPILVGEDPLNLERIRIQISQRGYISRQPMLSSPIEQACMDIVGKRFGVPVHQLIGGQVRDRVPVAAYLFYRYANDAGDGAIESPAEMVEHARELVDAHGFRSLKLKGGVHEPEHEALTLEALREAFGADDFRLRFDPNATWSPATAMRIGERLRPLELEYYEDPAWGLKGLQAVGRKVAMPIATNMAVIEFEQLGAAVELGAIDVILSDPWYWGGIHHTKVLDAVAKHLGIAVGMHSGIEFGVGLATMLHTASSMPNLVHAIDSHYHHLTDDVIATPFSYEGGCMAPGDAPGLGVELDPDKMDRYVEVNEQLRRGALPGHSTEDYFSYPTDPTRPDWYPVVPMW
ncbi:MAG: glucarate dehydratase [Thermoleophilaceae bacterium]|jgi:glucarate dehydratase|nr:glucarate dehydratase [Thermoleophilaceae bacterium]